MKTQMHSSTSTRMPPGSYVVAQATLTSGRVVTVYLPLAMTPDEATEASAELSELVEVVQAWVKP